MKLDNKVKEDYIIFSCFGTEQAKQYVDTKGYFTNDIGDFSNLDDCYYGTLNVVDDNSSRSYLNKDVPLYFNFFLPEEFVKEKQVKKKYRPYTIVEFCLTFKIGQPIRFRNKETKCDKFVIFSGYELLKDGWSVMMGNYDFTLEHLFNKYEWQKHDTENYTENYQPFGVEVEE